MDKRFLDSVVAIVENDGVTMGLNACHAKQVLLPALADPAVINHLIIQIFGPIAEQQADCIRKTVLAAGGGEQEVKVLIHKFGQGILLGGAEGLLS